VARKVIGRWRRQRQRSGPRPWQG